MDKLCHEIVHRLWWVESEASVWSGESECVVMGW